MPLDIPCYMVEFLNCEVISAETSAATCEESLRVETKQALSLTMPNVL